jgi:antitoxin VapB
MNTAKIFLNGRSQAVRLPKDYRFDTNEVMIAKLDEMVILYPRKKGWDLLCRAIERFTGDFMEDRDQSQKADSRKKL